MRNDGSIEFAGMEEHDTIEDMLHYVHLSTNEVINKFEEKTRWAPLKAAERKLYTAEFLHALKQSSYLSTETEDEA